MPPATLTRPCSGPSRRVASAMASSTAGLVADIGDDRGVVLGPARRRRLHGLLGHGELAGVDVERGDRRTRFDQPAADRRADAASAPAGHDDDLALQTQLPFPHGPRRYHPACARTPRSPGVSLAVLDGRVAIVTGGGSGVGHGIALGLSDHGAAVAVVGAGADAVAAEIVAGGRRAAAASCAFNDGAETTARLRPDGRRPRTDRSRRARRERAAPPSSSRP